MEEDERIGLMVRGRGLGAKAAREGLEMFWGTLRSGGRYSELWGCSTQLVPQLLTQTKAPWSHRPWASTNWAGAAAWD